MFGFFDRLMVVTPSFWEVRLGRIGNCADFTRDVLARAADSQRFKSRKGAIGGRTVRVD
jgi:hypothetical protein